MKRLNQCLVFEREIEEISMMDLRSRPGEVMTSVSLGKTYIISRAGAKIAVLMRLPGERLTIKVSSKGEISYKP